MALADKLRPHRWRTMFDLCANGADLSTPEGRFEFDERLRAALTKVEPAALRIHYEHFFRQRRAEIFLEADEAGCLVKDRLFVFTGTIESMTRHEAKCWIESLGGRVTGTVRRGVHYVVAGPGAGSKLRMARNLGIPVLDEPTWLKLMHERTQPVNEYTEDEVEAVTAVARAYCAADGLTPFDQLPDEERTDELTAAWRVLEALKAAGFSVEKRVRS